MTGVYVEIGTLTDYRERLVEAERKLKLLALNNKTPKTAHERAEFHRLRGKLEGVRLAISYFDEMKR